jgi:hypothetical protein
MVASTATMASCAINVRRNCSGVSSLFCCGM